jgi:hypothetical protein
MIFGIREFRLQVIGFRLQVVGLGVMLALAGGCQVGQKLGADRNDPTPILTDSAMQVRDWPTMRATYPCFSSTVGSAQSIFVPRADLSAPAHAVMETPVFVADTVLLPLSLVITPPWEEEEGVSFYLPPSYTTNPPVDPVGPKERQDLSGGPSMGWTPANGRAEQVIQK